MNFIIKSSLEHMALVKVLSLLWNQPDIRALIIDLSKSTLFFQPTNKLFQFGRFNEKNEKWKQIKEKVMENMAKITTPPLFNNWYIQSQGKLLSYIDQMGLEIQNWLEYHLKFCVLSGNLDFPNELIWTSEGTIDKKKTAVLLVRNESIAIILRYQLACIYCLEDDVRLLWNGMHENHKQLFYNDENSPIVRRMQGELAIFWANFLSGKLPKMDEFYSRRVDHEYSSYKYLFLDAARSGNTAATEYFLKKINTREELLVQAALLALKEGDCFKRSLSEPPAPYCTEVAVFLLSQMGNQQQLEILKACPYKLAGLFLNWPWQSLFAKTVNHLWNFLSESRYYFIFHSILHKVKLGFKDYNYNVIFRDVWNQISGADKCSVINDLHFPQLFYMLMDMKDKDNLKLVFNSAPTNKFLSEMASKPEVKCLIQS